MKRRRHIKLREDPSRETFDAAWTAPTPELAPALTEREREIVAARERWAASLDDDDFEGMENLHPDERMIPCPAEFLLDDEWETRVGRGYVLGDGTWYDPCSGTFCGCITKQYLDD